MWLGMAIWDNLGSILAFGAQKIGVVYSPTKVEALAILRGLIFTKDAGLMPTIIEEIESSKKKSSTVGHTEDTFEGVPPLEKQREYKGRGKRRREEEEKGKRKRKERKPTGKKKEREMANGDEGEKRPSTAVKLKEDLRQKW
ncbi:hypothetical protein LWI29_025180 [Acer saccharum]|uniref:RNase H type-1 domain-containing protein n=1 Tax=Acer saccharum TaxID=4024 RepID=A0AA39SU44_ACESA|nr:hypothetical protein LWI29_025180 [Acer saccharum]